MTILQNKWVNFNSKLMVSNTGGNFSTDAGLILVKKFMDSIGFTKLAESFIQIGDDYAWEEKEVSYYSTSVTKPKVGQRSKEWLLFW